MIDHSPYDNMEIPSQLSSVVADALACGQGKQGNGNGTGGDFFRLLLWEGLNLRKILLKILKKAVC